MNYFLKKKNLIISIFLIIVALFLLTFYFLNRGMTSESEIHTINVTESDSYSTISQHLEDEGVIRSASFMKFILRFKLDKSLYVGLYDIDASWSTTQIIGYLNDSNNAQANVTMVTLPSGGWAKDFAAILETETNLTSEALLSAWNDPEYITQLAETYPFLSEVSMNDTVKIKLEGYLYPDTYEFDKITTIDAVTHKILDKTSSVLNPISDDIKASGFSTHELLTLASIVNYEGNSEASMRTIASVFLNRLNINMTLGSSVTICYALETYETWQDCERNTNIDSLYNTYIHTGLPPGPVMNPTVTAINAVLHPDKTNYLYFVADVTTGEIYYAKTYAEHLINVEKYVDPHR